MYVGSGASLEAFLGEAISATNVDVITVSVNPANTITVKTSQQLDGTTPRAIVDSNSGFVNEITVVNTDRIIHSLTIRFNSGSESRQTITVNMPIGSTLMYKPKVGWSLLGFDVSSGTFTSGMFGNAAVVSGNIGSGQVSSPHLVSGSIAQVNIGNSTILSGSIASGQINTQHIATNARMDSSEFMSSDNLMTAEIISGGRGITLNRSGALVIAMAGQSGRFPAIGIAVDNVLSGQILSRYFKGRASTTSFNLSGGTGELFLGLSGTIEIIQPLQGASGLNQLIGFATSNSGLSFEAMASIISGMARSFNLGSGAITSGAFSSGAIGLNHLASGSVRSGAFGSGVIGTNAFASNALMTNTRYNIDDVITTEEAISGIGIKAVNISQSGRARTAMAGVSGRMPAIGILFANVASGQTLSSFSGTPLVVIGNAYTSGTPVSGTFTDIGSSLFVGMSGTIVGRTGITSGMLVQRIGHVVDSGYIRVKVGMGVSSGLEVGAV